MSLKLETSITQVAGVGEVLSSKLKRLGIYTVRDLLYYFPFRYEDFSQVSNISDLQSGQLVTIAVQIEMIGAKRSPRRRLVLTEAVVTDDSDCLKVIWFNQPYIAKTLKVGDKIFLSGKVTVDRFGLSLQNPSYERMKEETVHTARLVPLYPLTEGITQKQIRFFISEIIGLSDATTEWIPKELLEKNKLLALSDALRGIHFPKSQEELTHCLERLKFDELFVLQLRAEMLRQELARVHAPQIKFAIEPVKEFVARLPFELTKDQRVAAWEIFQDIEKGEPMNRLLEGDVGSGKTAVAALALFLTAHNGFQGAIMAPTEILANQHLETLQKMFAHTDISIALVTHSQVAKKSERTKIYEAIKNGEITITIGTHALLSEGVEFKNLGLVIVDEQHRFGVTQRKTMKEKSGLEKAEPHFLSMTATPIPRSLALTLYGDLDVSQLRVKPAGRLPIETQVVSPHERQKKYEFIREQVKLGRQVFVICPTINADEKKSVTMEYEHLATEIFPDLRVGWLHGKLKAVEKDAAMQAFASGALDILVATSVVEVGVNIPNATVMMIEGAESFGLAQLHQFRGRVGRSDHQSFCFVFTDSDSTKVKDRLAFFASTTDGFQLAEFDLETRGPGEVYGQTQSGLMQLKLATLQDTILIKQARELARGINFKKYPSLAKAVADWETETHRE